MLASNLRKGTPFYDWSEIYGMDVHKDSILIAVRNDAGKLVMECVIEIKANVILDFIDGLRGELHVTSKKELGPPGCTIC